VSGGFGPGDAEFSPNNEYIILQEVCYVFCASCELDTLVCVSVLFSTDHQA